MPRRVYTYPSGLGWDALNLITTIGAFIFALGRPPVRRERALEPRNGAPAGNNPWDAPTLEWAIDSPPPPYNFAVIPTVGSRYPLWEDRISVTQRSRVAEGPALDDGRETAVTSPLDADRGPAIECRKTHSGHFCSRCPSPRSLWTAAAVVAGCRGGHALGIGMTIAWLWPKPTEDEP